MPGGHPAQAGDVNDSSTTPTTEEDQMITVTVSGRDAEALTARLAELLAGTGAQVAPAPRTRHLTAVPTTVTRAADVGKAGGR